jgi:GTP-binding protein
VTAPDEGRSPWSDFQAINYELACFNADLAQRPQLVIATKMDLPEAAQRLPDVQQEFAAHGYDVLPVSAVTGTGLDTLRARLATCLGQVTGR